MNEVLTDREDGVLVVTLNRPERLNALDRACHDALDAIWTDFDADDSLRCAILTGAGERAFCAGSDLKYYHSVDKIAVPESGYAGLAHRRVRKPIIAAVNGVALGGGFEVVMACDLVIASERATFGFPEVRIGGAAFGGGLPRLMRKIPYTVALGLALTARTIDAAEAWRLGLANEVAAPDKLMDTAMGWARDIILGSPLGVIATKELAESTLRADEPFDSLVGHVDDARQRPIMESEDFKEAVTAFAERRPPVWRGR